MGDSTITVSTQAGDVIVRKMPLSDYAELLRALDSLPTNFVTFFSSLDDKKLEKMNTMDFIAMLPELLAGSWDDIIGLVAVPTDKDAKFISQLDAADAMDILTAIVELNDFARISAAVKKMLALKAKLTPPAPSQT